MSTPEPAVTHGSASSIPPLPPPRLRPGARELKDDGTFLRSSRRLARTIDRLVGLDPTNRLADIGCGSGRLLYGLSVLGGGGVARYVGIDTSQETINWATGHLAGPGVEFRLVDLFNERYNPSAAHADTVGFLPFGDAEFDRVALHSVFSHMRLDDIALYLREVARLLEPGGRVYCSAFVEDGVPDWTENPDGYVMRWSGPLHCARVNRDVFDQLVADAGLVIIEFEHRPANQSLYGLQNVA